MAAAYIVHIELRDALGHLVVSSSCGVNDLMSPPEASIPSRGEVESAGMVAAHLLGRAYNHDAEVARGR